MEDNALSELCVYCKYEQETYFKFCPKCGKRNFAALKAEKKNDKAYQLNIRYLAVYSIFSIILLLIINLTGETFESLIIWTLCFAGIDIVFALLQSSVWDTLKLNAVKIRPAISIIAICISTGFIVYWSMDYLNVLFFEENAEEVYLFSQLEYPLLWSIILIGVFPAFFEELAFRGFVFNNLKIIGGTRSAILGSTFLFALVHLSLLSFIWIIPLGLLLSFYRHKYGTLIYGMLGHFTHNTTVILIEYYALL